MGSCPSRVWPTRTSARCGGSPRGAQRARGRGSGLGSRAAEGDGPPRCPLSGRIENACAAGIRDVPSTLDWSAAVWSATAARCSRSTRASSRARSAQSPGLAIPRTTKQQTRTCSRVQRMARPGLEPGTPRFSVVRSKRLSSAKSWKRCALRPFGCSGDVRSLRRFAADSGDGARLISRSRWCARGSRRRSLRVSPRGRDTDRRRRRQSRPPATSTQVRSRRESSRSQRLLRRQRGDAVECWAGASRWMRRSWAATRPGSMRGRARAAWRARMVRGRRGRSDVLRLAPRPPAVPALHAAAQVPGRCGGAPRGRAGAGRRA